MFAVIISSFVALIAGVVIGCLAMAARKSAELQRMLAGREAAGNEQVRRDASALQRALAERDLAISERRRSEGVTADALVRVAEEQQLRVAADTRLVESQRLLNEKESFIEGSKKQLEDNFSLLAQRALKTVTDNLLVTNKAQLEGSKGEIVQSLDTKKVEMELMLKPLRDMLDTYRGELTKSEYVRNEIYGGLQEQIRTLVTLQESAQRESSRLANALQSPTVRGSWGENSLRRCIEMSGMSEHCDFKLQETFSTDEGRRIRPDCVISLPNNRVIAIDSKAPLTDYTAAAEADTDDRKRELLVLHAKTLRRHIDALSRKEYQESVGQSLDFTVMFIPGEHFLSAALVSDPTLFDYAVTRKIYLASPTILLPLLRAIEAGWKAERTEENARKMHETGVELFDRFVNVMEHINKVGISLDQAVGTFNKAIRSIDTRLWPKASELQRLAGRGKELEALREISSVPLESNKLRLATPQADEEPGLVETLFPLDLDR